MGRGWFAALGDELDRLSPEKLEEYRAELKAQLCDTEIREGTPQMLEPNDIRWITTQEIPQYEFCPADETILKKLRSGNAAP